MSFTHCAARSALGAWLIIQPGACPEAAYGKQSLIARQP